MTAEARCGGCDRVCACTCGCRAHSHYRHCLTCSEDEHRDKLAAPLEAA